MIFVNAKVNVINYVFFTESHANPVVISTLEILKIHTKMEQHFQDSFQKCMHDNNLDSFAAHFAKTFTQKPSPQ